MNIETITEQALKLEPALRAYVAEILLESLDYEGRVRIAYLLGN